LGILPPIRIFYETERMIAGCAKQTTNFLGCVVVVYGKISVATFALWFLANGTHPILLGEHVVVLVFGETIQPF
jgi:hypothetical protein